MEITGSEIVQEGTVPTEGVKQEATVDTSSPEVQDGKGAQEENLPFGKHPRWIKMQTELKDLRMQHETLSKEREEYAKAIDFHKALSGDPAKLQEVMKIIQAEPQKTEPSGYDDFDPIVADKFKQIDAVSQKLDAIINKIEQQEKASEARALEDSKARIDTDFDNLMIADGYMDKEGKGDQNVIESMESLTLISLSQISKNPFFATPDEVKAAYEHAKAIMTASGKFVMKSTVATPPPSGTASGKAPAQRGTTEADRIARLMNI